MTKDVAYPRAMVGAADDAAAAHADARFRRLMQTSGVGMSLTALDGRFQVVNQALCDFFGYDAETLCAKTWQELTEPGSLKDDLKRVDDLLSGRLDTYRVTKQYIRADGTPIWGDLSASCLRDSSGAVECLVAQIIDVTDEVECRSRQAQADSRFRRMMENSRVGMSLNTPDGRFVDVNEALCDMLGYDAASLCAKTWQEVTAPTTLDVDIRQTNDLAAGLIDNYRTTKQFIHADGHFVWADLSASCIRHPSGELELFVAQFIDITDEVEAREKLAESEQRNRTLVDRLKTEMLSAAEYVESVLPRDLHRPVAVSSRYLPALELGGDGFHFRWIDDDHLKMYLIDVSGHGIRPALLSMSVHNLIRSDSLPNPTLRQPDRLLTKLNHLFQMDDQGGAYFSIWYGVYRHSTRTLTYASAGHPPALALSRSGDTATATTLSTPAVPIGMFADTTYTSASYEVPPGGQLLLYSDGAFELPVDKDRGDPFSHKDFVELCSTLAAQSEWSLDELLGHLKARSTDGGFDDDCALILATFP